jgi:hypothetical protein
VKLFRLVSKQKPELIQAEQQEDVIEKEKSSTKAGVDGVFVSLLRLAITMAFSGPRRLPGHLDLHSKYK